MIHHIGRSALETFNNLETTYGEPGQSGWFSKWQQVTRWSYDEDKNPSQIDALTTYYKPWKSQLQNHYKK